MIKVITQNGEYSPRPVIICDHCQEEIEGNGIAVFSPKGGNVSFICFEHLAGMGQATAYSPLADLFAGLAINGGFALRLKEILEQTREG